MNIKKIIQWMMIPILCLSSGVTSSAEQSVNGEQNKVAFVIDDFGNNMDGTQDILNLPIPLTIAVMPFLPSTKKDAEIAHQKKHDVYVHLPMEPVRGKKSWLGPGAITTDLSNDEIRKKVNQAIDDVPFAIGVNNHMGSKATADPRVMRVVLEVCRDRGLIYLDSRTTHKSVVPTIAKELGVTFIENTIFLDDVYSRKHIRKQMMKLSSRINDLHECIAIGHVGPPGKKTASVLNEFIPVIQKEANIVLVSKLAHK